MNTYLDLVRELKSLRKGRGVFAGRIEERVGPTLRATCGITEDDGPLPIRGKLTARLTELAEQLPEDLRLVTLAAFAITTDARLPLYRDRIYWAATKIDRDPRTVRRRVDNAIGQLAELAATSPHIPTATWRTAELRVSVALDLPRPEILALYRIIADQHGLQELSCTPPFPIEQPDLDVLYGGTLRDHDTLTLPETLTQGESHNFAIRFRLPTPHAMPPSLVHVPEHPCDLFDLRIRFGHERKPPHVWPLHGERQSTVGRHPVDRAGEIHLWFRQLTPGLAYGARWETSHQSVARRTLLNVHS